MGKVVISEHDLSCDINGFMIIENDLSWYYLEYDTVENVSGFRENEDQLYMTRDATIGFEEVKNKDLGIVFKLAYDRCLLKDTDLDLEALSDSLQDHQKDFDLIAELRDQE